MDFLAFKGRIWFLPKKGGSIWFYPSLLCCDITRMRVTCVAGVVGFLDSDSWGTLEDSSLLFFFLVFSFLHGKKPTGDFGSISMHKSSPLNNEVTLMMCEWVII